jgi:hypothetical protein
MTMAFCHFGSRKWPLGGDSFCIGRHFQCKILAAPCSSDDFATWVAMLVAWVAIPSQEVLLGGCKYRSCRRQSATFENQNYFYKLETPEQLSCAVASSM